MSVDRARELLEALTLPSKTPGIQYLVVNAQGPLFEFTRGEADIAEGRVMVPGTTQMAYSMSKTITAAAVLQLVDNNAIGLDDPIDRYVEGQPYGNSVTVRRLLSHTAGLPNPIPLSWVHPVGKHGAFDEPSALAAVLRKHSRLRSTPGTKYAYSNIGYWLLGPVVERVSRVPFTTYVRRSVIERLGVSPADLGYAIENPDQHATGYLEKYSLLNLIKPLFISRSLIGAYAGRWLEIRSHYLNGPAFGGLVGSCRGFGAFLQDQLRPQSVLFSETTRKLFYAPQQLSSGAPIDMTLGWHIGHRAGSRYYFKEGGGGGFHSMMRLYPDSGIGTVAIANATSFDIRGLLDRVDASFLVANPR